MVQGEETLHLAIRQAIKSSKLSQDMRARQANVDYVRHAFMTSRGLRAVDEQVGQWKHTSGSGGPKSGLSSSYHGP